MSNRVEFEGELIGETDKAYCIDLGQEEDVWIAKSLMDGSESITMKSVPIKNKQNSNSGKTYKVDWIKFDLAETIAQEKGLI